MKPKRIFCLAFVLSSSLLGCSPAKPANIATATVAQSTFEKIEQRVPELACLSATAGVPGSGQVWHGEEYASATFVLRKGMILRPAGEFPQNAGAASNTDPDLSVIVTRYVSSSNAHKDLDRGFRLRSGMTPPKEIYKGAALYRYASEAGTMICHAGRYIIEIIPNPRGGITPSTIMKVLDVVLTECGSQRGAIRGLRTL
jgi:hypothetical protein